MPEVPKVLADFTAAVNRGDTPAFLGLFTADGVVDDWGRRFAGHARIKEWSDAETIGAHGTLTITVVISADAPENRRQHVLEKPGLSPAPGGSRSPWRAAKSKS